MRLILTFILELAKYEKMENEVIATPNAEKPPDEERTADTEADKLRAMVEVIKNKK